MASVWRAEDYNLKRAVAIKLMYFEAQRDPSSAVEQFLREARIAAAVQHRNVVHTMDFGTTSEGVPYMVMELLQGETLAARMQRDPQLRVDEWIRIAEMTLRGLAAVHDAGIVHRDLKPQNIFLQRDGDALYPKILDFGISRSLGADKLASPITTQAGFVLGTPHYMAPEQASGEGHVDHRADIYSVGTILYEGLSGRLPFDAEATMDLLRKILSSDPTPLRELVPKSVELIAECVSQSMARDPEQRFMDARAFRSALTRSFELSFPTSVSVNRSELPVAALNLADLPKVAATGPVVAQNDATRPAWGDFEGLAARQSSQGSPVARGQTGAMSAGRASSGAQVPVRAQSAPLAAAGAQAPNRAASGAQAPQRAASAPLVSNRAGSAPNRAPSGPLDLDRVQPGQTVAERAPSPPLAAGRTAPELAAAGPLPGPKPKRAPSGPLVRDSPAGSVDPVRPRRVSSQQQEAVGQSVPDAAIAYPGEGALLGDNPLDAFAGSAAVALELDFAPWQDRKGDEVDPKERQKNPVQQVVAPVAPAARQSLPNAAPAAPLRVAPVSRRSAAWWWLLPGALALLFGLFVLLPGLFSMAPPDQTEARAREAEAAATRGSTRVLQLRPTPAGPSNRPEERELLE
jgi:serine/threonine-protein kinase